METIFVNAVSQVCLICLMESETDLEPISAPNCEDLTEKIEQCGGIKILKDENYPDQICPDCFALLNSAYKFRVTCQQSQQELLRLLRRPARGETIDKPVERVKVEYEEYSEDEILLHEIEQIDYLESSLHSDDDIIDEENHQLDTEEFSQSDCNTLTNGESATEETEEIETPSKRSCNKRAAKAQAIQETKYKLVDRFNNSRSTQRNRKNSIPRADPLICHHCGNQYSNRQKLTVHLKLHKTDAEKEHECEICSKRFVSARQLQIHMNTHTGNRPYKCKYCSKAFGDPSSRVRHERVHDNIKPYKCDTCEKKFTYSHALKKHQRIHTGEKPFSCIYCDKRFTLLHHKKAHESTHEKHFQLKNGLPT